MNTKKIRKTMGQMEQIVGAQVESGELTEKQAKLFNMLIEMIGECCTVVEDVKKVLEGADN